MAGPAQVDSRERKLRLLDRLYDATADARTPEDVAFRAMRILRDALGADRCAWADVEDDQNHFVFLGAAAAEGMAPAVGRYPVSAFGDAALRLMREGRSFVCHDAVAHLPKGADREAYRAHHIRALVAAPVHRGGRFIGGTGVHMATPRIWTAEEIELIEIVTKRCGEAIAWIRTEAALRASEERYRAVVDNQSEMVCRFRPDGTLLFVNASYALMVGRPAAELFGCNFWDFIPAEQQTQLKAALQRLTPDHPEIRIENQFDSNEGPRWTLWTNRAIRFDAAGRVLEAQSSGIDITDRKLAEDRVRATETMQRLLLDSTLAFIGVLEPDGTLREANAPALQAGGLTRDDVVGKKFWDCYWWSHDPFEIARLKASLQLALRGEVVRYDAVVRMAGDTRMTIDFMLSPVKDDNGDVKLLVPSGFDITDRKRAEELLRDSEARYRALFEAMDQGFCVLDLRLDGPSRGVDCRVVEANPAFFVNTGMTSEIMGRWLRELAPELESGWFDIYRDVVLTGEPTRFERRSSLLGRWFDAYAFRLSNGGGSRVAVLFTDISERKRQEDQMQLLLREVNHRAKNLLSLVQSIAKQTAATRPEDFLARFERRVQALATNQDLLVRGDWTSVPLVDLARSQLAPFEARVTLSGPAVRVNAQAAQTLSMALHELATNAAKYGALSEFGGKVALTWGLLRSSEAGSGAQFSMSWVEEGGPPVQAPKGQGFGTKILQTVVNASFGTAAELQFRPEGLRWGFVCAADRVLVDKEAPSSTAAAEEREGMAGRRILVVEDEPLIALELAEALESAGLTVVGPVGSVRDALPLVAHCDAAALDVNLGSETSEAVAHALAQAGRPFVVVSGYERGQQPLVFREAPHVAKPINTEALVSALKRLLQVS